jgi:hypothetical protein
MIRHGLSSRMSVITRAIITCILVTVITIAISLGCKGDSPTADNGHGDSLRVTITSPVDSAVVSGATPLEATATGSAGAVVATFYLDGTSVSADSSEPFQYVWNPALLPNGSAHSLKVIAKDASGQTDTSRIITLFANYPRLCLTVVYPANGAAVPSVSTPLEASVAGGAGGSSVRFYIDNVLVTTDSSAPFQCAWDPGPLPSGSSHGFRMIAADTAGQADTSAVRTMYARFLPLVLFITFPPDAAILGQTMGLQATTQGGSDTGKVMFVIDGALVATDSFPPFAYNWNPDLNPIGTSHSLQMIVKDTSGQSDTSAILTFHDKWRLLATGDATTSPINIRKILTRSTSSRIEFRVDFDSSWTAYKDTARGIDCALFIDSDRNRSTGDTATGSNESQPIGDIGADYKIVVGLHGDSLWVFDQNSKTWVGAILPRALHVASPSNYFELAVYVTDIGSPSAFNLVAANVHFVVPPPPQPSIPVYDWVPLTGHLSFTADGRYYGPPVAAPPSGNAFFSR